MESLTSDLSLVRKDCFMASIDLKDAYYTVPVHRDHQKYLKFFWIGQLYQFTVMTNGLSCAPRYFTKLLRVPFSYLRSRGHTNVGYIDDSFIVGDSQRECAEFVSETAELFTNLGFVLHSGKSVLMPTQELTFLGFVINSSSMTFSPAPSKAHSVKQACATLLNKDTCSIRDLAEVIGYIVACFPGVQYGPLHFRRLDNGKSRSLRIANGNFDSVVVLNADQRADLQWWVTNVCIASKPISVQPPSIALTSDASEIGWGATRGTQSTGGRCILKTVVQKVEEDQAKGLLVAPLWPTQPWFPRLLRLLTQVPVVLPPAATKGHRGGGGGDDRRRLHASSFSQQLMRKAGKPRVYIESMTSHWHEQPIGVTDLV
ncbi:uncharacterized protein [Haliotis asinina]|uniref:uncharacterized protein n=1 Tax=Haliotis asinina TaxID=109174 RepID=UPI0035323B3D